MNSVNTDCSAHSSQYAMMLGDSRLPADIKPPPVVPDSTPRVALVTGVTGFLGRFAVRELLLTTDLSIVCITRAHDQTQAKERVTSALCKVGVPLNLIENRVLILQGDMSQPLLGLQQNVFNHLGETIDLVYHLAADVNWVRSYRQLRPVNVLGTLEILRFASFKKCKPLFFVSTIAVCYAENGPAYVDETTDMSSFLARMPLGYAQSKHVAETLLRAASTRGLPVTILRPALISGDTQTGKSNNSDFIAALIEGSTTSRAALDVDWLMDCIPVDTVAKVIATQQLLKNERLLVLHLMHDNARHWREVVLWMNLAGYPVRLLNTQKWLEHTFTLRSAARTRLYAYRRFFQGVTGAGCRPFEIYLGPVQRRIDHQASSRKLKNLGITIPPLDALLLNRYFENYKTSGLLPHIHRASQYQPSLEHTREVLAELLRKRWQIEGLEVSGIRSLPFSSANGILNEITSASVGSAVGMHRYALMVHRPGMRRPLQLNTLVKIKATDRINQENIVTLASLCDPVLSKPFQDFVHDLHFSNAHERELAIYELQNPKIRRHSPRCFGTARDFQSGHWMLALEFIDSVPTEDISIYLKHGLSCNIQYAIPGLASIHGAWYGRESELDGFDWLAKVADTARMVRLIPLWHALRIYAWQWFCTWTSPRVQTLHEHLIDGIESWWPQFMTHTRTLIHNDFNPRNFAFRQTTRGPRLCAFDWELAAVNVPQYDLAELLVFTADKSINLAALRSILARHCTMLESESGRPIDWVMWQEGFALALRHFLIERLPMYTLIHRFRPQRFLPAVLQNWLHLYDLSIGFVR